MIKKIDLSGSWNFCLDAEKRGIIGEYCAFDLNDTIELPGTTSQRQKGAPNPEREDGCLTDRFKFDGWAWYSKRVDIGEIPENTRIELFLERTRLTTLWVNGIEAGSRDSLCSPHIYDITDLLTDGENVLTILVSNVDYPTKGGHLTSRDTQTNWNGIIGEIALVFSDISRISAIRAYPDVSSRSVRLRFITEALPEADIMIWGASSNGMVIDSFNAHITENSPFVTLKLGDDAVLWSEFSPVTYTVKAAVVGSADIATVTFGLREITPDGLDITLNGEKIQLRGRHDGMIFPLTGACPTTVNEWYEYLQKAKDWGLNHVRFHTCCPPDAAFTAADLLGIYMQPEIEFWGSWYDGSDENYDPIEDEYLTAEGRRIIETYGEHPSFVMMSLGNELWGSPRKLNEILGEYRELDSRHLYTQGSNNFQFFPNIQPNDDFFSGVRLSRDRLIRGSYGSCDAPLGFVQTEKPNTVHSFDKMIFPTAETSSDSGETEIEIQYGTGVKKVKAIGGHEIFPDKPIITHETGQYCTYPDFGEIPKYTGILAPYDLEIFRERLAKKGMLSYADELHRASGMLAFKCYKLEIEAAMRSEHISGFQLLDLQDFCGQGAAFVGMLDAFMDEKSFVRDFDLRRKWRGFCGDLTVLAEIGDFVLKVGREVRYLVILRNMRPDGLFGCSVKWTIGTLSGEIAIPNGFRGLAHIGEIGFTPDTSGSFELTLEIVGTECCENTYSLYIYPEHFEYSLQNTTVCITSDIQIAQSELENGGDVLYIPKELPRSIPGFWCTDFWCYPMFRSISESMGKDVAVGTLGLLIDSGHKALNGFFSEFYSTPQWFGIVSRSDSAILDDSPEDFRPIVQVIDNFERNHKLGLLYEAKVGSGRLMVCTCRIDEAPEIPEIQAFTNGILAYMSSADFDPKHELTLQQLGLI